MKYEWNQFHGKLEECKQTADLSIQKVIVFLYVYATQSKIAVLHSLTKFLHFFCAIIISVTDVFSKNYGPQY